MKILKLKNMKTYNIIKINEKINEEEHNNRKIRFNN